MHIDEEDILKKFVQNCCRFLRERCGLKSVLERGKRKVANVVSYVRDVD